MVKSKTKTTQPASAAQTIAPADRKITFYPWWQKQWQQWAEKNRWSQWPTATLWVARAGWGAIDLAKQAAQRLLCQRAQELLATQFACQTCHSCQLFLAGHHPDCRILQTGIDEKSIKIDAVRAMSQRIFETPQISQKQVVILEPAEAMTLSCANALLKTLEEPPDDVHFILICYQPRLLPATIRSRCQQWNLHFEEQSVDGWVAQFVADRAERALLLSATEGAPLLARSGHAAGFLDFFQQICDGLQALHKRQATVSQQAQQFLQQSSDSPAYLWLALELIARHAWYERLGIDGHNSHLDAWLRKNACNFLAHFSARQLSDWLLALHKAHFSTLHGPNFNVQLLLENLLIPVSRGVL